MAEKWEYYWSHQWFLSRVYILSFSHITWTLSRHFNMNQKILFITVWPDLFSTQTRDDDTSCWWRKLKEGDGANPSEMCLTVFVSSSTSVITLHFIQKRSCSLSLSRSEKLTPARTEPEPAAWVTSQVPESDCDRLTTSCHDSAGQNNEAHNIIQPITELRLKEQSVV